MIRKTSDLGSPRKSVYLYLSLCKLRLSNKKGALILSALGVAMSSFLQLFIATVHITVFIIRFMFYDYIHVFTFKNHFRKNNIHVTCDV